MTTKAEIIAEMDAIEAIARQLAAVANRRDAARKLDLVAARRELAMRMMKVMSIGEDYAPIRRNEPLYAELRQRLNVLRTAIAEHQAKWSAVAIDSDDAAYIASSAAVQAEGRAFMGWVRQVVESVPE